METEARHLVPETREERVFTTVLQEAPEAVEHMEVSAVAAEVDRIVNPVVAEAVFPVVAEELRILEAEGEARSLPVRIPFSWPDNKRAMAGSS